MDQGEKAVASTGTVLPAGQNAAFGDGHSVELGPLQVLDLDYSEKLNLRDLRRLPTLQSYHSDFGFSEPSKFLPGVSRGQVTPSSSAVHSIRGMPVINKTVDKYLPFVVVSPVALALGPAGYVAVGVNTYNGATLAGAYIHGTGIMAFREEPMGSVQVFMISESEVIPPALRRFRPIGWGQAL